MRISEFTLAPAGSIPLTIFTAKVCITWPNNKLKGYEVDVDSAVSKCSRCRIQGIDTRED